VTSRVVVYERKTDENVSFVILSMPHNTTVLPWFDYVQPWLNYDRNLVEPCFFGVITVLDFTDIKTATKPTTVPWFDNGSRTMDDPCFHYGNGSTIVNELPFNYNGSKVVKEWGLDVSLDTL